MRINSWPFVLCLLIIILFVPPSILAADDDLATAARVFVKQCLGDTNMFVYNPPAALNAYKDLSEEQRKEQMTRAMRDGSLLFLNLDGLPVKFESRKKHQPHGVCKTWYAGGRLQSEETFD